MLTRSFNKKILTNVWVQKPEPNTNIVYSWKELLKINQIVVTTHHLTECHECQERRRMNAAERVNTSTADAVDNMQVDDEITRLQVLSTNWVRRLQQLEDTT